MKVNFVVPSTSTAMGGGIRVIFNYANYLAEKGHDVVVYVPIIFTINKKFILKTSLANTFKRGTKINWMKTSFRVKLALQIKNAYIRNADIVIATTFYTAPFVFALNKSKGEKVYLIQGYEIWNQDERIVDETYTMDMHRIVVTKKLHDLLYNKFKVDSKIIYNGHNSNEYIMTEKQINNPKTVMMLWNSAWFKGGKQALSILECMHKKFNIKIILFSVEPKPLLPNYIQYYHKPERNKLIALYQSADIYLFSSNNESWGLPIIEAMANKCAVVGMNTGCLEDLCIDGEQALIAKCNDYNDLENKLNEVLTNEDLMKKLQISGFNFSKQFSWDKQNLVFEEYLQNITTNKIK